LESIKGEKFIEILKMRCIGASFETIAKRFDLVHKEDGEALVNMSLNFFNINEDAFITLRSQVVAGIREINVKNAIHSLIEKGNMKKCEFCEKDVYRVCKHGFCRSCGCKEYCWLD